jgi:hypothetical protein
MDSLAENSIERRTLASSTSGRYFLVLISENSRSALSCYPVMHKSYAGRSHNASTRLREGLLRLHSGTPNIRQPVASSSLSSCAYSFTIHCPPALIPRILNDSISFSERSQPFRLSCDCHTAASSGISQGCPRLSEAVRGFAWG